MVSLDSLHEVLATAVRERSPDVVLLTGDIAHDSEDAVYQSFQKVLAEYTDCPSIATPGNHDLSEPFLANLPTSPIEHKGWRVVAVDTHRDHEVAGFVDQDVLSQLTETIDESTLPTLVIGHHPATPVGTAWIDGHGIQNGEELLEELCRHSQVKGLLCGHVHQEFDSTYGDLKLMTTPSTCWQFKKGSANFEIDSQRAGWRWLTLRQDGTIETTVSRLPA